MANPYESPSAVATRWLAVHAIWWCGLFGWLYPVLLVGAFYMTWLVAWIVLGHMPRPSLDDPKYIGVAVDVPYVVAGLLLVGFPGAVVVGVSTQLAMPQHSWSRRLLWCGLLVFTWAATIALLWWDPLLVGEWYFD